MELTVFDHILAAILFIVLPVLAVTDYRKFLSRLRAGKPRTHLAHYRGIMVWSWGLVLAVAALWIVNKRSVSELGFGFETGLGFWIGLAITVVSCGLAMSQAIGLRRDPEKLRAVASRFESARALFPRTREEVREFSALSITAGVCEEIIYRGYLMLYFASAIPIGGILLAAFLSSLGFGLGHTYQGPMGVLKTGLLGLAMVGLYLLSGSLWLLIVLHTVLDLIVGSTARQAIAADELTPATD